MSEQKDTYLKQLADEADMAGTYLSGVSGTSSGPQQSLAIARARLDEATNWHRFDKVHDDDSWCCKRETELRDEVMALAEGPDLERIRNFFNWANDSRRKIAMSDASNLREALTELRDKWVEIIHAFTSSFYTVDMPMDAVQVLKDVVKDVEAALTSGDGTPRPWVSEAMLNKIAPFLEGVDNAHLRATQIVSALASGDGSESAGLREALAKLREIITSWRGPKYGHKLQCMCGSCQSERDCADDADAWLTALAPAIQEKVMKLQIIYTQITHSDDCSGCLNYTYEPGASDVDVRCNECGWIQEAAISRPPTQPSLPPSRADLGGDRIWNEYVENECDCGQNGEYCEFHDKLPDLISKIEATGTPQPLAKWLAARQIAFQMGAYAAQQSIEQWHICCPERTDALAEGQQSSELVEKTPSASPGERE